MKVLHVIPSLSPTQGGPSVALPLMARSLAEAGITVDVATTDDDGPGRRVDGPLGRRVVHDGYGVFQFRKQTEFYKVSLPFHSWVRRHARDYDLLHIHALFSFTSVGAAHAARRSGVPYIIRPLGLLNRWGMQNRRRLLKSLSFRWIERPILRHAAAMHYTARSEQAEAERSGATAPGLVVPLGIDLAQFAAMPGPEAFWGRFPETRGRLVVLYLSRIDPKKGLDLLLPAFALVRARFPNAHLVIAGSGEGRYMADLREQAASLGIGDDILWAGFLSGADKLTAFAAATVFTLPSYSENFGIALAEALATGLPCVTTEGVALCEDVREYDAGLVVPCDVTALADALERLLGDPDLRARLGANARRLATERFSLEAMGTALKEWYQKLRGKKAEMRGGGGNNDE